MCFWLATEICWLRLRAFLRARYAKRSYVIVLVCVSVCHEMMRNSQRVQILSNRSPWQDILKKCKNCPPRSSRDLKNQLKPKNPKILKVVSISQFSRYRRKILYPETCIQALTVGIAKLRYFYHLILKLRSRQFFT